MMRLKNANSGNLGDNIRVFQTLFFENRHSGGYADAPPPAKSTRASPSAFNLSGWIPPRLIIAAINRITTKVMPINRGAAA